MFFGLGILRRFLVWPPGQIWPANFPSIALLRTLHEDQTIFKETVYGDAKRTLREKLISNRLVFYFVVMILQFVYSWFPNYIMPILGSFSWICMIKPNNYVLTQVTGISGLGIGSLTFGWLEITFFLGSPLVVPRWALVNIAVGFVLITWIITPIVYFTDVWGTRSYAIAQTTQSTTNWSAIGVVTTATTFASLSSVLVHMLLHHGNDWWKQLRTTSLAKKGNDLHCRLISLYPDVPDWWFAIISVVSLIVILVVAQVSQMLPWYNVLFAFLIAIVFVLPFGMVASITGQIVQNQGVYFLGAVIAGALWASDQSKMLTFLTISYTMYCQTIQLVSDMKLAHYMKLPPRSLFLVQASTCLICSSFSISIQYYF